MRGGEAITARFTPAGEQAIRSRSERDAGMEQGTKHLKGLEPSIPTILPRTFTDNSAPSSTQQRSAMRWKTPIHLPAGT